MSSRVCSTGPGTGLGAIIRLLRLRRNKGSSIPPLCPLVSEKITAVRGGVGSTWIELATFRELSSARLHEHADVFKIYRSLSRSLSVCLCLLVERSGLFFTRTIHATPKAFVSYELDRELPNARGRKLKRLFTRLLHRARDVSRRDVTRGEIHSVLRSRPLRLLFLFSFHVQSPANVREISVVTLTDCYAVKRCNEYTNANLSRESRSERDTDSRSML